MNATVRPENARGLVSAGLYSSVSTWMFNLVAQIIIIGNRANVKTVYMDEVDEAAADALREASFFVAKSHMPGPSLRALVPGERFTSHLDGARAARCGRLTNAALGSYVRSSPPPCSGERSVSRAGWRIPTGIFV